MRYPGLPVCGVILLLLIALVPAAAKRDEPGLPGSTLLFADDFSGRDLSAAWVVTTPRMIVSGGQMRLDAAPDTRNALSRPDFRAGRAALILFQYTRGTMGFRFEHGDYDTDSYRRVGFAWRGGWQGEFSLGRLHYPLPRAALDEDTFYYLLLRVGAGGQFFIDIWERDDPFGYVFQYERTFTQAGFADQTWTLSAFVEEGQLRLAHYEEWATEADFALPETPYLPPRDLLHLDTFERFNPADWDFVALPAAAFRDGDGALRLDGGNFIFFNRIPDWSDYTLLLDVSIVQTDPDYNALAVWGRSSSAGAYIASLDVGTYRAYLSAFDGRAFATVSNGIGSNLRREVWQTIRFQMIGPDLRVFVGAQQVAYGTDGRTASGSFGFSVAAGAVVYVDNLRIVSMRP